MTDIKQIMRDAAVQRDVDQRAEFSRVEALVLGDSYKGRDRVTEVIALEGGHIVEVTDRDGALWTTVHNDRPSNQHFYTQHEAILHLIAQVHGAKRHDTGPARFAGRVLGMPEATQ